MKILTKTEQQWVSRAILAKRFGLSKRYIHDHIKEWIANYGLRVSRLGTGKTSKQLINLKDFEDMINRNLIDLTEADGLLNK